jgi:hypothetical protein
MNNPQERLALAVWDAIGDILGKALPGQPDSAELELAARKLVGDPTTATLFSPGSMRRLCQHPLARDMALAYFGFLTGPSEENFRTLRLASRAYEEYRLALAGA